MSLPSTCTSALCRVLVLIALATPFAAGAQVGDVEKALMPGAVISGHAKYEHQCAKCHKKFDKAAQTQLCLDCHKDTAADVRAKSRLHGHLKNTTCRECHTDHEGRGARIAVVDKKTFDHDQTNFRLRGGHKTTKNGCDDCHKPQKKFRETPSDCYSCHKKDDDKSHKGGLGKKCEDCHSDADWKETRFDHDKKTKFKLLGKHKETKCKECHVNAKYKETPKDCHSCHKKDDYEKDGGHRGKFGTKCEKCHGADDWKKPLFDHDRDTKYRLKGKHREARCTACHKGNLFTEKLKTTCLACHRKDDFEKGHQGSLGDKCESCHNERGWKKTSFDHDKDTKYPLKGKHRTAKCESCHKSGLKPLPGQKKIEKLPTKCIECHRKDDQEKGHKGQLGDKCESCHTEREWKVKEFDHNRSRFPLSGAHARTECKKCHKTTAFREAPRKCIGCHEKDDNETHKGVFGDKCETCHGSRTWKIWDFNHDKATHFPIDGAHRKADCYACHKRPDKAPARRDSPPKLDSTCVSCHDREDVHNGGFGLRCELCHFTDNWKKIHR